MTDATEVWPVSLCGSLSEGVSEGAIQPLEQAAPQPVVGFCGTRSQSPWRRPSRRPIETNSINSTGKLKYNKQKCRDHKKHASRSLLKHSRLYAGILLDCFSTVQPSRTKPAPAWGSPTLFFHCGTPSRAADGHACTMSRRRSTMRSHRVRVPYRITSRALSVINLHPWPCLAPSQIATSGEAGVSGFLFPARQGK